MIILKSATRGLRRLLNTRRYRREAALQRALLKEATAAVSAFPTIADRAPHTLPGRLIVSLTSYPPRFETLHLTLRSLLDQSVSPDETILWLADKDLKRLPDDVTELCGHGLTIKVCGDLRSYKKLVPALRAYPNAFIVVADDDLYYPNDWLQTLLASHSPSEPAVLCRRAHRPARQADGRMRPYLEWKFSIICDDFEASARDIFPTTGAGTLYPPGSLADEVLNEAAFMTIAPHGDDLWFYWMARLNGSHFRQVGGKFTIVAWPESQQESLFDQNAAGRNDVQIRALEKRYGPV